MIKYNKFRAHNATRRLESVSLKEQHTLILLFLFNISYSQSFRKLWIIHITKGNIFSNFSYSKISYFSPTHLSTFPGKSLPRNSHNPEQQSLLHKSIHHALSKLHEIFGSMHQRGPPTLSECSIYRPMSYRGRSTSRLFTSEGNRSYHRPL